MTVIRPQIRLYKQDDLTEVRSPDKFDRWLLRIARNAATDFARKKKPAAAFEDEAFIEDADNFTEETWLRRERQQTVWKALGELEEKYRMIIAQYYLGGYTAFEISKLYGLSLSAVACDSQVSRTEW